jgi:hypothetical protein
LFVSYVAYVARFFQVISMGVNKARRLHATYSRHTRVSFPNRLSRPQRVKRDRRLAVFGEYRAAARSDAAAIARGKGCQTLI